MSYSEKENIQYTREELEKKLTGKEKRFCEEYVIDWNGARSARDAGYSENTCYAIASENLTKPYIKQYIEIIKNDIERLSGVSKLRNIQELSKIAYSSVEHIHNTWIELKDWELIKEDNPTIMSAIESIDTKVETRKINVSEGSDIDVEVKYVKVKFFSKISAITEINKMMGYNQPNKIELSGKVESHIITTLTPDELKKSLEK